MRAALILVVALAACSSEPASESNGVEVVSNPTPTPTVAAKAGEEPDKSTPISQQSYDFAGTWAVSEELCRNNGQWRFTRESVETDGETSCAVSAIRNETGVGATLDLSCTAEGAKTDERWEVLTAPEGGMIVQRYVNDVMTGPQQRLMRCEGA